MKISKETQVEIQQMRKDGLSFPNIANYLGVSQTACRYYSGRKEQIVKNTRRWQLKNREHFLEVMRGYKRRKEKLI